jgi:hypothetical protein
MELRENLEHKLGTGQQQLRGPSLRLRLHPVLVPDQPLLTLLHVFPH